MITQNFTVRRLCGTRYYRFEVTLPLHRYDIGSIEAGIIYTRLIRVFLLCSMYSYTLDDRADAANLILIPIELIYGVHRQDSVPEREIHTPLTNSKANLE